MSGPARLEIDATEENVAVARAFVAGALRALDASEAAVAAARLAVSELVTALVRDDRHRVVVTAPAPDLVEIVVDRRPELGPLAHRVAASVAGIEPTAGGWRIRVGDR